MIWWSRAKSGPFAALSARRFGPLSPRWLRHGCCPLALSSLLSACSGLPFAAPTAQVPAAPAAAALRPAPARPASTAGLALQPLPSAEQVRSSLAIGRLDPFLDPRPPAAAAAPEPSPPRAGLGGPAKAGGRKPLAPSQLAALGPAFKLTGVVQTGDRSEAIVQNGDRIGSLVLGERGGDRHPLLPKGWIVESIDSQAAQLRICIIGQQKCRLFPLS